jgi:hypothetical protein
MPLRTLIIICLLISTSLFAAGRRPAVEDFVGIEFEQKQVLPQGTESLYNLEQDIQSIENQKRKTNVQKISQGEKSDGWSITVIFGMTVAIGLPMIIWFLMMSHLKRKASLESASNIEVLEKYRKEREKKTQESIKRVS